MELNQKPADTNYQKFGVIIFSTILAANLKTTARTRNAPISFVT
jgi:hypothetical protein